MEEIKKESSFNRFFDHFSTRAAKITGSSGAFLLALSTVLIWAITGPIFNFSENWQLVINTGTTIVTFLMVFLIQKAQNKDSIAIQLKLNELIAATKGASNRLVAAEEMDDDELELLCHHYHTMAELTRRKIDLRQSHSVEEAIKDAENKLRDEGIETDNSSKLKVNELIARKHPK